MLLALHDPNFVGVSRHGLRNSFKGGQMMVVNLEPPVLSKV